MKPSAAVAALAVYTRNFNQPSGLEDAKRVTLFVSNWYGELRSLMLNDRPLEFGPAPIETDVSSFLKTSNRIEIQLASIGGEPARLAGEVRLQITD